jgi:hypothetical protein
MWLLTLLGLSLSIHAQNSLVSLSGLSSSIYFSYDKDKKSAEPNVLASFAIMPIDTVSTITMGIGSTATAINQESNTYQVIKQKDVYYVGTGGKGKAVLKGVAKLSLSLGKSPHKYVGQYLIVYATDKNGNRTALQSIPFKLNNN